jgi:polysaccharide biosynthesis protein PslG
MRFRVLLILWLSLTLSAQTAMPERALLLHRFPISRQASDSADFQMAFAIGDDYFDGRDSRARVLRHLSVAKAVGARYLRCGFSWNGIEPEDGRYEYQFWDMLVDEANKAGIQVIPYVAYTPEWAARSKENFWQQPPRDPALFARLMRNLAAHFQGRISSWELWNEPDLTEYWQGTPEYFAEVVKAGARGVREGNPSAVIVLGGMSHGPSKFFDELLNRHHIERWVDVIAMHGYPETWDEERLDSVYQTRIAKMQQYIDESGQPLDLWLNEMGYADYRYQPSKASPWGTDIYYGYEHTSRYAADALFRSFVLCVASGKLSLAGWYRIDDFRENDKRMPSDKTHYHLGVMDVNGKPKPEFYAMQLASRLLQVPLHTLTAKFKSRAAKSKAIVKVFQRADGRVVVTGWLRSSKYNEVATHTGFAKDRRTEHVDLQLPCAPAAVVRYDAVGKKLAGPLPNRHQLTNIDLTGNRTYIAEITCR